MSETKSAALREALEKIHWWECNRDGLRTLWPDLLDAIIEKVEQVYAPIPVFTEKTSDSTAELTALKAIQKHYPVIAGHVIRLQQDGEEKAAAKWATVAEDFYAALEQHLATQPKYETTQSKYQAPSCCSGVGCNSCEPRGPY
jgi:hypothetical protein